MKRISISRQFRLQRLTLLLAVAASSACANSFEADAPTAPAAPEAVTETGAASAAVRTHWPSAEDPGPPFYARIEPRPPHVPFDGDWAAVVFYRDPDCIPADFNLITFFDAPAAFACPVVMQGASLWASAPFVGSPMVANQSGNAVPVWFVPADEMLAALAGGHLTIGQLKAMPGRITAVASNFSETLHPHPLPPELGGGGHPNPGIVISAQGSLQDGRRFQLQHQAGDTGRERTRITFR